MYMFQYLYEFQTPIGLMWNTYSNDSPKLNNTYLTCRNGPINTNRHNNNNNNNNNNSNLTYKEKFARKNGIK